MIAHGPAGGRRFAGYRKYLAKWKVVSTLGHMTDLPNRDEARQQLTAARDLAAATARRGGLIGAIMTAGVGLLVAAALAATYLTMHWPWSLRTAYCLLVALPMVLTAARMLWGRPA
jgi:hypothetical protein